MKFDLIAIGKLSPAGLWDLAGLAALIATVQRVICLGIGSAVEKRRYGHMLARYQRQLREQTQDNLNMRIKAWVLQCPERISYVRGVIGARAIRRWNKNRLLDYALTEIFGAVAFTAETLNDWKSANNWKSAFLNGLKRTDKTPSRHIKCGFIGTFRSYNWKRFALVKIANTERILFGPLRLDPAPDAELEQQRPAYFKLWGVDISSANCAAKATQPRQSRTVKPVRFVPDELALGAAKQVIKAEKAEMSETSEKSEKAEKSDNIIGKSGGELFGSALGNDPPSEHGLEPNEISAKPIVLKPP